ncbi:MAG TPA: hypothetical protein VGE52_06100 [Pirellulales bacterium]
MTFFSAKELAAEMMRALDAHRETSDEHWERLVRSGFINRKGEVTRVIGGHAEPDPDYVPSPDSR